MALAASHVVTSWLRAMLCTLQGPLLSCCWLRVMLRAMSTLKVLTAFHVVCHVITNKRPAIGMLLCRVACHASVNRPLLRGVDHSVLCQQACQCQQHHHRYI